MSIRSRRRFACAALVGLLAACGGGQPAARDDGGAPAPSVSSEPTASEPTTSTTDEPVVTSPPQASTVPPASTTVTTTTTTTTVPLATVPVLGPEPVAIASPAIGLLSSLQHVGLQADDGGVEVPDFEFAGWYRFGGRPGAAGPTVFVGHVDSRDGPAVFYRLRDLEPGDLIEVGLADGTSAQYAVTGTEQFPKAEFPTFAVFGATDQDLIRLVTCTGEFDRGRRSYYDNLVVTAVRVP